MMTYMNCSTYFKKHLKNNLWIIIINYPILTTPTFSFRIWCRLFLFIQSNRFPPSQYSIIITIVLFPLITSCTFTTCLSSILACSLIYWPHPLNNNITYTLTSWLLCSVFSRSLAAYTCPVLLSVTLYTVPNPPWPIMDNTSYCSWNLSGNVIRTVSGDWLSYT